MSSEKTECKKNIVKVSVIQTEPEILNKEKNIKKTIELIKTAANNGSKLIVLPELCNTGYVFNSREEVYSVAEEIPDGDTIQTWEALANELGVYISAGLVEKEDFNLYNTSVLVGPDGHIGKYRKVHLWNEEKLFLSLVTWDFLFFLLQ